MANYLFVSLDTVLPVASIISEDYLDKGKPATITIQADKPIASYTVYFMDSNSIKHDLQLTAQDNTLTGTVDLSQVTTGVGALFVTTTDTVMNSSKISRKAITIVDDVTEEIEEMGITIQTVNMAFIVEVI